MKTRLCLVVAVATVATATTGAVSGATLYVSLESTNPVVPYATWETAATNIQDAVDAAQAGDTVLVTNGVYAVGSREISVLDTNQEPPQFASIGPSRVVVTNSIKLESVNGPSVTTMDGDDGDEWVRCLYMGGDATVHGITLRNGRAGCGSGAYGGMLYNCTLVDNYAGDGGAAYGSTLYDCRLLGNRGQSKHCGGAWNSTLYNCTLSGNSAFLYGGGAEECTLYNCTLSSNSAWMGGGAFGSTLYNCTLTGNTAEGMISGGGGAFGSMLYNCTLTGNSTPYGGGGVLGCTLFNCTLTNNSANSGGGASGGTLYNCIVTSNSAWIGGGAFGGTLYNSTLAGNSADWGGGVAGGTLYNSIAYYNTAPNGANYFTGSVPEGPEVSTLLNYSCTTPIPTEGIGNITGPPLFLDMAAGDFRLREASPCIDAGTNLVGFVMMATNVDTGEAYVSASYACEPTDILGNTRFIDGNGDGVVAWDIGAYEFNSFKPPRFAPQLKPTPNGFEFTVMGEPGQSVRIERSRNLMNWEEVATVPLPANGQTVIDPVATTEPFLFYRAVSVP